MIRTLLATGALVGLMFAGAASEALAGDSAAMQAWKADCSRVITRGMGFRRSPNLTNAYNVIDAIVDRSGEVIEARLAEGSGVSSYDRETARFASKLETLPALPDDFADERALVRMYIVYADNQRADRRLMAKILAKVTTEQLAREPGERKRVAGLPVIDMVGGQ